MAEALAEVKTEVLSLMGRLWEFLKTVMQHGGVDVRILVGLGTRVRNTDLVWGGGVKSGFSSGFWFFGAFWGRDPPGELRLEKSCWMAGSASESVTLCEENLAMGG